LYRLSAAALLLAPGNALTTARLGELFFRYAPDIWWSSKRGGKKPEGAMAWQKPKSITDLLAGTAVSRVIFARAQVPHHCKITLNLTNLNHCSRMGAAEPAMTPATAKVMQLLAARHQSQGSTTTGSGLALSSPVAEAVELPQLEGADNGGAPIQAASASAVLADGGTPTTPRLQQMEEEAAAAAVQLITGSGLAAQSMLHHVGCCTTLGIDIEAGSKGRICLVQVGLRTQSCSQAC
jgi:hypothetical protein